jgi:DNA-binding response OmpR family regulator
MNSRVFGGSPFSGSRALVVEPEEGSRLLLASRLSSAGLSVTGTGSFRSARASLREDPPPSVLVTEVRLGAYNGLHLALIGRSLSSHMTLVVTSRVHDRVLQRDAEELGATFVRTPMTPWELLAPLYRAALREPDADGTFESPSPPPPCPNGDCIWLGTHPERQTRGDSRRRREIATFLLREASRR